MDLNIKKGLPSPLMAKEVVDGNPRLEEAIALIESCLKSVALLFL
jgi:hypothetical protein